MKKGKRVSRFAQTVAAVIVAITLIAPLELGSEMITLSTTYPSPVGIYHHLITTGAQGSAMRDTILNRDGGNTLLAVNDPNSFVGIGTANPQARLDVRGGKVIIGDQPIDPNWDLSRIMLDLNGNYLGGVDDIVFNGGANAISWLWGPNKPDWELSVIDPLLWLPSGNNDPRTFPLSIKPGARIGIGTGRGDVIGAINGGPLLALGRSASNPANTMGTHSAGLVARDVAGSTALFSWDEAGNVTQISPHDPDTGEWVFYSVNTKTGRAMRVNMENLVREVERLSGKKLMVETTTDAPTSY